MGLDTKTYWRTDRQSQCDFDFELKNIQEDIAVESTRTEWSVSFMNCKDKLSID
jgi:hypothetical protein